MQKYNTIEESVKWQKVNSDKSLRLLRSAKLGNWDINLK